MNEELFLESCRECGKQYVTTKEEDTGFCGDDCQVDYVYREKEEEAAFDYDVEKAYYERMQEEEYDGHRDY